MSHFYNRALQDVSVVCLILLWLNYKTDGSPLWKISDILGVDCKNCLTNPPDSYMTVTNMTANKVGQAMK